MPGWAKVRWKTSSPWIYLGLVEKKKSLNLALTKFSRGLLLAAFLLVLLMGPILLFGWGEWLGSWSPRLVVDALLLVVWGLLEELIFRGWLWHELEYLISARLAIFTQAAIFSVAHIRFTFNFWDLWLLLLGLFVLGLILAARRILDKGSLWGCIGLHGGLAAGWFVLTNGLISLSSNAPIWLVGPANPIGGGVPIAVLCVILLLQVNAVPITRRPSNGARNASSKGATP